MIRDVDEYLPNDELDLKIYLKRRPENRVRIGKNFPAFEKAWKCTIHCFEDNSEQMSLQRCATYAKEKYWKELVEYFTCARPDRRCHQNLITACYAYLAAAWIKYPMRLSDWELSYIFHYFNSVAVHPHDIPQIYHFLDEITCLLKTGGYGCLSELMQNDTISKSSTENANSLLMQPPSLKVARNTAESFTCVPIPSRLFMPMRNAPMPTLTPVGEGFSCDRPAPPDKSVTELIGAGSYEQAITLATRLLRDKENKSELYFHRGMALMRMHKYVDALLDMERALAEPVQFAEAATIKLYLLKKLNIVPKTETEYMIPSPRPIRPRISLPI